jgi:hypothetical protein
MKTANRRRINSKFFKQKFEWEGRKVGLVHTSALRVDHEYQRFLDSKSVREKADLANFDRRALRTIVTALRDDGYFYILDGQTRNAVTKLADIQKLLETPQWVSAEVHIDLTRKQEGNLFPLLNNFKNVTKTVKFKANLFAGASKEKAIVAVIHAHGLAIRFKGAGRPTDNRTTITSLGTLDTIWSERGEANLDDTLYVVTNAFRLPTGKVQKGALMQQFLKGVSFYLYESKIDADTLLHALRGFDADVVLKAAQAATKNPRSDPWRALAEWIENQLAAQRSNRRRKAA